MSCVFGFLALKDRIFKAASSNRINLTSIYIVISAMCTHIILGKSCPDFYE